MKKHIENAIIQLQGSPDPTSIVRFTHTGNIPSKSVSARVFYGNGGKPAIAYEASSDYNVKYIKAKLNSDFNNVLNSILPSAGSGDTILTRQFLNALPPVGTVVDLADGTYYYRVNGGLISCNGNQLNGAFRGRFQGKYSSVCATGGAIMDYSTFDLL
ncbi:hypothetical protein MUY27_00275 [Mucilaginibacter sp. RS28]|uniref:Uncharacterized protein n=1 Tax=Mucilaginibacter straminoryzae TaxID=2932774 RepID=A0A9X1X163_9SPHI|nr:hypothetical protein [Mucilaginibacter straminoryzae]MCJ8208120.1 hypothetical protein [Mucilaginibacter straminoryzae]